jgi:hypothetical protein
VKTDNPKQDEKLLTIFLGKKSRLPNVTIRLRSLRTHPQIPIMSVVGAIIDTSARKAKARKIIYEN